MPGDDQQLITTISDWAERGVGFALATVVGVRGSTYRGLAARQLMAADGTSVGTVSGGCLDSDLSVVAARVRASGRPELVEFDLTADDEAVWGWGIGCNGVTELLVEPENSSLVLAGLIRSMPPGIVHVLSGPRLGSHLPVTLDDPEWGEEVLGARVDGRHRRVDRGGQRFMVEVISGRPRLVVCGAGHDAVPLVRLASELGFEVSVVDDRRQFLSRERFPEATTLVHCAPADLATHVPMDPSTAVVIMSHNYLRDLDFLGSLLGRQVAYIGCLGPGERLERMMKDLAAAGTPVSPEDLERIHGPAGIDLGADGPTEIAWSVLSEILAVRRGAAGGFLVDSKGPSELRRLPEERRYGS
jgi:xanthine/CO dehydrogenase XdhC/CoxF family maturation factor